jgi:hypothetical protein
MREILIAVVFLVCSTLPAQDLKNFVLAQSRSGVIEIIDPATLATVSQIHFDVRNTAGLNGVAASTDGARLYVEGPITDLPGTSGGCCFLYSIDLATLHAKKVEGIWGTRKNYLLSDGFGYRASELSTSGVIDGRGNDVLHLDPSGHILFGVRSFRGPVLDVYDLIQGSVSRRLAPAGLEGDWFPSGAWSGDQFYFYAARSDGSAARLWNVSANTTQLGPGVTVETFGETPACSGGRLEKITAAGGNLFVYELFGSKIDRRDRCQAPIPGGAWLVNPETGQLLRHDAPDLHFTALISDRTEPVLYGLSAEGGSNRKAPVELVRIDTRDGLVMQSRVLDADFWWIAAGPLRATPSGNVEVVP